MTVAKENLLLAALAVGAGALAAYVLAVRPFRRPPSGPAHSTAGRKLPPERARPAEGCACLDSEVIPRGLNMVWSGPRVVAEE